MDNAKLFIFFSFALMAVCMDLLSHQLEQRSVLYCSSSICMKCAYSECTIGQDCTMKYGIFPECPPEKWRHLYFRDETPSSETSIAGHQDAGNRARRDVLPKENVSFSNCGVYLCDTMESKRSPKCLFLIPHHQAKITINGITKIYKGSCYQQSVDYLVRAKENDLIEIDCQLGELESNCSSPSEPTGILKEFSASRVQLSCSIKCKFPMNGTFIYTINIKLDVGTLHNQHLQGTTERPLSAVQSTTLGPISKSCLQVWEGGDSHPLYNTTPVSNVLIMFLFVVVLCLMALLLLKSKKIRYRRNLRSIELDSATRESVDPTITHTYAVTGYFGEGTPFRDDNGTSFRNQMLRFTRDSSQSNNTFLGLSQSQDSSIPRMITPYAVTCICSSDNSLRHLKHLPKSPGVDVSTYLDLSMETSAPH